MNTARTTEGRAVDADEKMSIFRTWADSFLQAPVEPMSKTTSGIFVTLILLEQQGKEVPPQVKEAFQYQVLSKRADWIKLGVNHHVVSFIASICQSPGELVMYCYALKHWQVQNKKPLTMFMIAEIFPFGFPNRDTLEILWDQQKIGGANLLDSIMASDFNEAGQDQSPLSAA